MSYKRLSDLKDIALESGNDNPTIWIIDMENNNYEEACEIEDIDLDNSGDIIIKINMELLGNN